MSAHPIASSTGNAIVDGGCGIVVASVCFGTSARIDLAERTCAVKRRSHQYVCVLVALREHLVIQGARNVTRGGDLHDKDGPSASGKPLAAGFNTNQPNPGSVSDVKPVSPSTVNNVVKARSGSTNVGSA